MVDLVASGDHTGYFSLKKAKFGLMIAVYVIQSEIKNYRYIGITNDLERRLKEHALKKSFYAPFRILLTENYQDYADARKREKFLKSGQGRKYLDTLS